MLGIMFLMGATLKSFAMVNNSTKNYANEIAWNIFKFMSLYYGLFLCVTLGLNFFIERKVEGRKLSKEYLWLFMINLTLIFAIFFLSFKDFNLRLDK